MSADEDTFAELQRACVLGDLSKVQHIFNANHLGAEDASKALSDEYRSSRTDFPVLQYLLEKGADPNVINIQFVRSLKMFKMLAEHGYDISSKGHLVLQCVFDHLPAAKTHTDDLPRDFPNDQETLDCLLDQGADISRTDTSRTDDGQSVYIGGSDSSLKVLNNVAATGNIHLFDHLVARGANPSQSLALHCASKCDDAQKTTDMISHLLDQHSMDINADTASLRDFIHDAEDCGTPLCSAIYHKNLAAIQELIRRGADIHNRGQSGHLPISKATGGLDDSGFPAALGPLLDAGADASLGLQYAVINQNLVAAQVCLDHGADPASVSEEAREQQKLVSDALKNAIKDGYDEEIEECQEAEANCKALGELLEARLDV